MELEKIRQADPRTLKGQRNTLVSILKAGSEERKAVAEALVKAIPKEESNVGVVVRGGVGFESDPE